MTAKKKVVGQATVLLVEDDQPSRRVLATHLARIGFEVTDVESAEEVPQARERHGRPFDVVVSDVHLPGISGIDLASMLLASNPEQPMVLITGDPDEALAREALSRGPVSYLLKPFQLFELEAAVSQALVNQERRRLEPPPVRVPEPLIAGIPADWLSWVDERSYAGVGHAERVAILSRLIASKLPDTGGLGEELELAAQAHELGIMSGSAADPYELARRSAELLADLGSDQKVVRVVKHMHERWDGTGGPGQLRGSMIPTGASILSVADSLDHYTAAWIQAGMAPTDAAHRAIGLVLVQAETVFSPEITAVVSAERAGIRQICGIRRSVPVQVGFSDTSNHVHGTSENAG